ncbi:MAG: cupin domain-containing protein [Lachnospiraceae bacterium]|nr:cupin domain-containing protein [Lachnospiraceae bacterium]
MNIILLSGGSGKRLWPLSNDIRSKQFIRLFKNKNGRYESMVQRVYRQITEVDPGAKVTIATSRTQVSAIRNQLGDKVSICVEPCRRDTFPAISLAAAYLHDELGVGDDECVVVCPVDPFVDNTYYEYIQRMERIVFEGKANLTLMGIEPTYPSDKYGYIIPEGTGETGMVRAFREKPDTVTAKMYLAQGALWNAGVFAFRLGYMVEKAHSMIEYADYHDLFSKYGTLAKISFDYAVVEKESSIEVMRYAGGWRDVGTWNMMVEVMTDATKGNVMLDEVCRNTNVVNELDIPILCMGCRNMVIAASGDGILVSDKERSGYMKPYVEKIAGEIHYAEKSWGTYTVIDIQPGSMTVKIGLKAGSRMQYHCHELRDEIWMVLSGIGKTIIDGAEKHVNPGDVVRVVKRCRHTLIAKTDMSLIEVQVGSEISKNDKTVFELPHLKAIVDENIG